MIKRRALAVFLACVSAGLVVAAFTINRSTMFGTPFSVSQGMVTSVFANNAVVADQNFTVTWNITSLTGGPVRVEVVPYTSSSTFKIWGSWPQTFTFSNMIQVSTMFLAGNQVGDDSVGASFNHV